VTFTTLANNLVSGDNNGFQDVFVHDRQTGFITLESRSTGGTIGNGESRLSSLSADGRFIVFESSADNLVPGDTNGTLDVFVRDRTTGQTSRVSVSSAGAQANGSSFQSFISGDGRFVVFVSAATNLVPGDTNGVADVFVRDRTTNQTTRVSVSSAGAEANSSSVLPHINADGRFVTFESDASNLVAGDTNGVFDVFVRDRTAGQTVRASVSTGGAQSNGASEAPNLSGDGRFVVFQSSANNLVGGDTNGVIDIFVRDLVANLTTRESVSTGGVQGNADSAPGTLNGNGRFVAFGSSANNLVAGDTNGFADVFARDRSTGQTIRASLGNDGSQPNGASNNFRLSLSSNAALLTYTSAASNLVAADTNGKVDVFSSSLSP
jgi:Tol biopolymer transport system component